jgi:hypothetical protein
VLAISSLKIATKVAAVIRLKKIGDFSMPECAGGR